MLHKAPDSEEIQRTLKDLKGKLLVVEGVRDEKALKSLGLKNIIKINRKPLYQISQEISRSAKAKSKEIVILTDFDREGRLLASRLMRLLMPYKVRVNKRLRKEIMEFGKPEIENLRNLKEDDLYVKVSASFDKIRDKGKDKGKGRGGKT